MRSKILHFLLLVSLLITLPSMAEEGAADARRYMVRGVSAIEMAKSNAELALAAEEFRRAVDLDPTLSAAWYNLGSVQAKLGQFDAAIQSYKHYLALAPNAEDAQKTQDEIVKLEFRQELAARTKDREKAREGVWVASDGTPHLLKISGNRLTLIAHRHRLTDDVAEAVEVGFLGGKVQVYNREQLSYRLEASGHQLAGTWMHTAIEVGYCTIPEESGEVTGNVNDAERAIKLSYVRTKFRVSNATPLLGLNYCKSVEPVEKKNIEINFRGPLPRGGLGVQLDGLINESSMVNYEWILPLKVVIIAKDSASFAAGLRPNDVILAIDGIEVKSLSAGDAIWRLRGEVGTEVNLTVLRKDAQEPVSLRLQRVEVPDYLPDPKKPWIN